MKIVRPEQSIKQKQKEELVDDNTSIEIVEPTPIPVQVDLTIENLMDEIIKQKDDRVQVTINLTKRQYDLYLKKGGEVWIKRVITGQKNVKRTNKNKR